MALPLYPNKHSLPALVTANKYVEYYKEKGGLVDTPPQKIFVVMMSKMAAQWCEVEGGEKKNFVGHHIFDFGKFGVLYNQDIGGAAMAITLEELAALGVKEFVCVGLAGGLNLNLKPGDIVLCDKALRDEGVSYHYIAESDSVSASPELIETMQNQMKKQNLPFHKGTTWTIDCPYRESKEEVQSYCRQGVLTVEMEAASMFAVAQAKKVKAASVFIISDVLSGAEWEPHFYHKQISASFEKLMAALICNS